MDITLHCNGTRTVPIHTKRELWMGFREHLNYTRHLMAEAALLDWGWLAGLAAEAAEDWRAQPPPLVER